MFKSKRVIWIALAAISVLLVFSLVGCAPDATDTPADEPGVVEPVEPSAPEPAEETSITILLDEDPPHFNGVLTFTGRERFAQEMVMLSLADLDPYGEAYPELAAELPTLDNGGVVADWDAWTMAVTWKLREDVYWEDGEQVTADDVIFTWDAMVDEETGLYVTGMDFVDGIEKIDDFTFVFYYNSIYPSYLSQLSMANGATIWPEHFCDGEVGFQTWDCNNEPLSNGPYLLEEWVRGDHLTFVRNPTYFEEGKPYFDIVYVPIVPEDAVRKTMMAEQAADLIFWTSSETASELEPLDFIDVSIAPVSRWLTQIWINQAARGQIDLETGAPTTPHPVLSDVRVRQAMRMAIDMDTIIADLAPNPGVNYIWTEFFRPPYNICDIPKPVFDLAAASALLEEAGWIDTDDDGVRECHGCTTGAPEGYEMSLEFAYADPLDELYYLLIAEDLADAGFDLILGIEDRTLLWDTFEAGGLEQTANFDLDMWSDGYAGTDPSDYLWVYHTTEAMIPDYGWNVNRFSNEELDALVDESFTIDEEYRKELFCEIAQILDDEVPSIPLMDAADITVFNSQISGVESTVNALINWNIADWTIVE